MSAADMQKALSTRELKLERKQANVFGLQLADLLAHPACVAHRCRRGNRPLPANFGGRISGVLEMKYRRSPYGNRIDGYGRKWLPV
jgi:hypothetical protein